MRLATAKPDVILRSWEPEDIPALLENANNRAVWRNLSQVFPSPYTKADAEAWITIANMPSRDIHLTMEVEGRCAGGIGIAASEGIACRTGQFGYWLGEPYWGQGIATAAARTMVKLAEESRQLARLEARVFAWNPSSMRVLEKAGFIRESVMRSSVFKDGEIIDSVMYVHIFED